MIHFHGNYNDKWQYRCFFLCHYHEIRSLALKCNFISAICSAHAKVFPVGCVQFQCDARWSLTLAAIKVVRFPFSDSLVIYLFLWSLRGVKWVHLWQSCIRRILYVPRISKQKERLTNLKLFVTERADAAQTLVGRLILTLARALGRKAILSLGLTVI